MEEGEEEEGRRHMEEEGVLEVNLGDKRQKDHPQEAHQHHLHDGRYDDAPEL